MSGVRLNAQGRSVRAGIALRPGLIAARSAAEQEHKPAAFRGAHLPGRPAIHPSAVSVPGNSNNTYLTLRRSHPIACGGG
jgi:hypothetical protein